MTISAVRVQEKGQVTIPLEIRRKLKLKKGDLVTFVETEEGVVIKPAEIVASDALKEIGEALRKSGVSLDEWLARGRDIRGDLLKEEYNLTEDDE
jgi:antitoxin PrlF